VEIYKNQLKSMAHLDPGELKQSLLDKERLLQRAKQAVDAVPLLEEELGRMKKREGELKNRIEEMSQELSREVESRGSARSRVLELKAEIPPDLHSIEILERLLRKKVMEKETIEQFIKQGKERADRAIQKVALIKGAAEEAKKALTIAQKAAQESLEGLLERLHQAGFTSPGDYREACISIQEIEGMERELREYTVKCRAAKQRVEQAKKDTMDISLPDMDALHQAFGAAKENLEKMIREEQDLNNEMRKIQKLITDIGIIDKESEELEKKFQTIGTLSDWANGVNTKKITFQRYVQARGDKLREHGKPVKLW
jgi:exonuclease SbcC